MEEEALSTQLTNTLQLKITPMEETLSTLNSQLTRSVTFTSLLSIIQCFLLSVYCFYKPLCL
jgi:hypothetical protein